MPGDERHGSLAFALVTPRGFPLSELPDALVGGTRITTYGRTWVMTEPRPADGLIHGRIGIVTTDFEQWDPSTHEFLPRSIEAGFATPYLLHPSTGRLVFQIRGLIKAQSFVNAFQHLLNEADGATTWTVSLAEREMEWQEFLTAVVRIEKLTIRVERPNPRFRSRLAERLVAGTEAASATLTLRADELGSIDSDAEVVEKLMSHADAYGQTTAVGESESGGRIAWWSKRRRAQVTTAAPADPESGEVDVLAMLHELEQWSDIPFFPTDE